MAAAAASRNRGGLRDVSVAADPNRNLSCSHNLPRLLQTFLDVFYHHHEIFAATCVAREVFFIALYLQHFVHGSALPLLVNITALAFVSRAVVFACKLIHIFEHLRSVD